MPVTVSMVTVAMAMLVSLQFARRSGPARALGGGALAARSVAGIVFVLVSLVSRQGWKRLDRDIGGGAVGTCARRGADS